MTCQRLVTATTTGPIAATSSTAPASDSRKNATARTGASSTKASRPRAPRRRPDLAGLSGLAAGTTGPFIGNPRLFLAEQPLRAPVSLAAGRPAVTPDTQIRVYLGPLARCRSAVYR